MSILDFASLHFLFNVKLQQHYLGSCKELKITSCIADIFNFMGRSICAQYSVQVYTAIQDAIRLHFFLLRKYNALVLGLPRQRVVSIYMVCYIWYLGSGFDILGLWTLILYLGTYLTNWVCNWRLGWHKHFLVGEKKDI